MVGSTLLYVLTFALFLSIPGSVTGSVFLLSTVVYCVWGYFGKPINYSDIPASTDAQLASMRRVESHPWTLPR